MYGTAQNVVPFIWILKFLANIKYKKMSWLRQSIVGLYSTSRFWIFYTTTEESVELQTAVSIWFIGLAYTPFL